MHHCIHTYETCIKVFKRHCTILNFDPLFVWRVATPRPFAAQAPIAPALLVWRPQSAPMEAATGHRLRSILKTKTPKEDLEVLVLSIPFTWFLQFSKTWILKLINPVEMKPYGRYLHHAWKTTWHNSPRFYFVEKPLKQCIFNTSAMKFFGDLPFKRFVSSSSPWLCRSHVACQGIRWPLTSAAHEICLGAANHPLSWWCLDITQGWQKREMASITWLTYMGITMYCAFWCMFHRDVCSATSTNIFLACSKDTSTTFLKDPNLKKWAQNWKRYCI